MFLYLLYYMFRKYLELRRSHHDQDVQDSSCSSYLAPVLKLSSSSLSFLVAILLGCVAAFYYSNKHQSRNLTPPESRDRNSECSFMDFFDNHDMWHFLSSTALFLAFIGLLTIDDDLLCTERNKIDVF